LPFESNVEIQLSENSEPEQVVCDSIV